MRFHARVVPLWPWLIFDVSQKNSAMKAVLLVVIACVFASVGLSADRPKRGQMKGMELYSWNERGKWIYVLVDGTNRLKSEDEVKKSTTRFDTVAALATRFKELAEGEHVVWNFHFVRGFSFPEEKTFSAVIAAAKSAQINLIADKK